MRLWSRNARHILARRPGRPRICTHKCDQNSRIRLRSRHEQGRLRGAEQRAVEALRQSVDMILSRFQAVVLVTRVRVMFSLEHELNGSMSILPNADPPGWPSQH